MRELAYTINMRPRVRVGCARTRAVGLQNNDTVEDFLIARADANHALTGLCVAIRHRMGELAKTLLTYMADVT